MKTLAPGDKHISVAVILRPGCGTARRDGIIERRFAEVAACQNGWHALRPRPARHRDPPPDLIWRSRRSRGGVRPGTRQPDSALDGETGHKPQGASPRARQGAGPGTHSTA